jgi:chemotaxis signal transduction protein
VTAAVPVVSFGVGGARFAVAPTAVARLDPAGGAAPHLAEVLALAASEPAVATRVLALTAAGVTRAVVVDGPLRFHDVTAAEVVARPRGWAAPAVLGFAWIDHELVQFLDADAVVRAVPAEVAP